MFIFLLPSASVRNFAHQGQMPLRLYGRECLQHYSMTSQAPFLTAVSAGYVLPFYTASFSSLAGRNAIFLLALILIASPVVGFRPIPAARVVA
jgi:hypothetical protein